MARSHSLPPSRFCGSCSECGAEPLWSPFYENRIAGAKERNAWQQWREALIRTQAERFMAWELAQKQRIESLPPSKQGVGSSKEAPLNAAPGEEPPCRPSLDTTPEETSDTLEREDFDSFASRAASMSASWNSADASHWLASPTLSDYASITSPQNVPDDGSERELDSENDDQEIEAESSMETAISEGQGSQSLRIVAEHGNHRRDAQLQESDTHEKNRQEWRLQEMNADEERRPATRGASSVSATVRSQPDSHGSCRPLDARPASSESSSLAVHQSSDVCYHPERNTGDEHAARREAEASLIGSPTAQASTNAALAVLQMASISVDKRRLDASLRNSDEAFGRVHVDAAIAQLTRRNRVPDMNPEYSTLSPAERLTAKQEGMPTRVSVASGEQFRSSHEVGETMCAPIVASTDDIRTVDGNLVTLSGSKLATAPADAPEGSAAPQACSVASLWERSVSELEQHEHEYQQQLEHLQTQIAHWQARLRPHLSARRNKLWKQLDVLRASCAYLGFTTTISREDGVSEAAALKCAMSEGSNPSEEDCAVCTTYRQRIQKLQHDLALLRVHLHIHEAALLRLRTGTYLSCPYADMQRELEVLQTTLKHLQRNTVTESATLQSHR